MITETRQDGAATADRVPTVSVVIIFFDEERFLGEAIQSVLAQEYTAWELLLVDDGSTDGSAETAQQFADKDSRIRYLTHPGGANRGMSASRNLGLSAARGEFVAFLDADDAYLPQHLRLHVEVLSENPRIAMSAGGYIRWFTGADGSADATGTEYARPFFAAGDLVWNPPIGLIVVTCAPNLNFGTCCIMVRRTVAIEVGGFEDSFRSLYEDQVFASKILARYPVYVMQAYVARYRHHSASWTRREKGAGRRAAAAADADGQRFVSWLLDYLRQHGVDDPLLLELVRDRQAQLSMRPGRWRRIRAELGRQVKAMLQHALPDAWYRRLLILDYEIDRGNAQRAYQRLVRLLARRALTETGRRSGQ